MGSGAGRRQLLNHQERFNQMNGLQVVFNPTCSLHQEKKEELISLVKNGVEFEQVVSICKEYRLRAKFYKNNYTCGEVQEDGRYFLDSSIG